MINHLKCQLFSGLPWVCLSSVARWQRPSVLVASSARLQIKISVKDGYNIVQKYGGYLYSKPLLATPAIGISTHTSCFSRQGFSTCQTSTVTERLRITTVAKGHLWLLNLSGKLLYSVSSKQMKESVIITAFISIVVKLITSLVREALFSEKLHQLYLNLKNVIWAHLPRQLLH